VGLVACLGVPGILHRRGPYRPSGRPILAGPSPAGDTLTR
jgi:hypothetical protein